MNITNIEKAAKLMGISINCQNLDDEKYYLAATGFNPYTNKADLSYVIDELGINIRWGDGFVVAKKVAIAEYGFFKTDTEKFAAKAEAVIAVAVQIYDVKYGKDGE